MPLQEATPGSSLPPFPPPPHAASNRAARSIAAGQASARASPYLPRLAEFRTKIGRLRGECSLQAGGLRDLAAALGATALDVVGALAVLLFVDQPAGHEIVEHRLQAEDRYQVVAMCLELLSGAFLAVQEDEHILHFEAGVCSQEGGRLDDAAAAGDEVVDEEDVLACFEAAFDKNAVAVALLGRVDVDERRTAAQ